MRRALLVLVGLVVLGAFVRPAQSHPMPRETRDAELYFARRCSDEGPRACIHRAAIHWEVKARTGYCIASHETGPDNCRGMDPSICNTAGSGACGLFQFMPGTYAHTPYDTSCGSLFRAKCAALAWAWYWHRGEYSHWAGALR